MKRFLILPAFATSFIFLLIETVRSAPPPVLLDPIAVDAFDALVGFEHAGDGSGRSFLVEQRGRILILQNGNVLPVAFLDIESKLVPESDIPDFGPPFGMFDERGLLGLAFHPDYGSAGAPGEGKFYVYYSAPSLVVGSNSKSVIAEYTVSVGDANVADPSSERILLEIEQPQFNHNGGQLVFGPVDGLLYIGTGDGGSSNDNDEGHTGGDAGQPDGVLGNSQDKTKLLGKILRIDVLGTNGPGGQYGIPATNPFVGNLMGNQEEIFALGVRNPWRFSFDRDASPQRLFCADVGQGIIEEINLIVSGGNYGWRIKEGNLDFDATAPNPDGDTLLPPIGEYAHGGQSVPDLLSIGDSVTGGYVYRGTENPGLAGFYVFGDWGTFGSLESSGTLLALEETAPDTFLLTKMTVAGGNPIGEYLYAFGEDEGGELYVMTKKGFSPIPAAPNASLFKIRQVPDAPPPPPVALVPVVVDGVKSPVALTHAGDGSGRLFVLEQRGQILVLENAALSPAPFLDIESKLVPESDIPDFGPPFGMFDERGLLGLAFHPDYGFAGAPGEGKFYVYYSAPSLVVGSNSKSVIAEYTVSVGDANVADPASERILLEIEQPQFNHNSGQIAFGPEDGFLYIGTGDGGSSNDNDEGHTGGDAGQPDGVLGNSQDKTKLLGKILRIDVLGTNGPGGQYGIPASNPYVGNQAGNREELFAVGLRNPWRFSFDRGASPQRLFCADVGQGMVEEIDLIVSGGNYGWRIKEGNVDFDATAPNPDGDTLLPPISEYAHGGQSVPGLMSIGDSVTGGYVYRGLCNPNLRGIYLFADWGTFGDVAQSGTLLALTEAAEGIFQLAQMSVSGGSNPIGEYIVAFGEDEDGEVYVLTKKSFNPIPVTPDGSIFQIREGGAGLVVEFEPEIDNTIFSETTPLSNGAGPWIYAGRTGLSAETKIRRALLQFDVASAIASGATIESATLTLVADKTAARSSLTGLHRVLAEWGEGASDAGDPGGTGAPAEPGDATWTHRIFNTDSWINPGGDFVAGSSASITVTLDNTYSWSDTGMTDDVQHWVDTGENFGWILVADEANLKTAKRFVSKDSGAAVDRPKLNVQYTGAIVLGNRDKWLRRFFAEGVDIADNSDDDFDSLNGLVEYGFGTNPLVANDTGTVVELDGVGDQFTLSFRRDIEADDLIYRLRVGDDLVTWTTVVEIVGTGAPTGVGFVSEDDIAGTAKYKVVTGRDPENASTQARRFMRVEIERIQL